MITSVEALHFRCLKYIRQDIGQYQILVGPNASGKTTFLDTVSFLGNLVSDGLDAAVSERTSNIFDLFWNKQFDYFDIAIEVALPRKVVAALKEQIKLSSLKDPDSKKKKRPATDFDTIRYEVSIGLNDSGQTVIKSENGFLKSRRGGSLSQRSMFPFIYHHPNTIITDKESDTRKIFSKTTSGFDHYYSEVSLTGGGWRPSYKLGPRRSTFGNLVEEEEHFPVSSWLKSYLSSGVQKFILNSLAIRKPSPPGQAQQFKPDGSNLPWVLENLKLKHPDQYMDWIAHIQTALPDIDAVNTVLREEDYHRYITIKYNSGVEVPSWMVSDGTLRLLALTIPAYLPDFQGLYLIEEPENGIHPKAMETITQSLSSVYDAQVLVATHSPVVLSLTDPKQVLCFAKTPDGATDIVLGTEHPMLRNWQGREDLGTLFAAGVLG